MTTGVLSYFDISLTSRVLGLCLVLEILILTAVAVAVLIHGGGPQGFVPESINPLNAFTPAKGWSAPVPELDYSSPSGHGWALSHRQCTVKSRRTRKDHSLATLLGVIGIGVFYVFISWMAIAGTGPEQAIALAQDPNRAGEIFYGPARQYLGSGRSGCLSCW